MPKGLQGFQKGNKFGQTNKGKHLWENRPHPRGMLGKVAWNKNTKGIMKAWNKDKKFPQFAGKNSCHWKGGKVKHQRGYVLIYNPEHPFATKSGYVFEHRLVIEKQIGRYLHKWEIGHHVNKIKTDNRPQNLMAFKNQGIHIKFETHKPINPTDIIFSGKK